MQDLSHLAKGLTAGTSMEAGNMVYDQSDSMSAPGVEPVTPMPARQAQGSPEPKPINKPRSVTGHGPRTSYTASPANWKTVN